MIQTSQQTRLKNREPVVESLIESQLKVVDWFKFCTEYQTIGLKYQEGRENQRSINLMHKPLSTAERINLKIMGDNNKEQLVDIVKPHDHDVLSGRGNYVNHHAGNENFRKL